ncbi:MAG: hypothetical protein Rhims3KO_10440 [Hyphomicrobiales bacterium]
MLTSTKTDFKRKALDRATEQFQWLFAGFGKIKAVPLQTLHISLRPRVAQGFTLAPPIEKAALSQRLLSVKSFRHRPRS